MWNKQQSQPESAAAPPPQSSAPTPSVAAFGTPPAARSLNPAARASARLGASLRIEGHLTGGEDLQIDGKVDGPISLNGHQLTVGSTAILNSEIHAGEVVVFGKIVGNVHAQGRVDIKTDGSVTGDISTSRISIEDGAHFKGRIEIDPAKSQAAAG
jgi:cytoskeletal protein CcmA (bactofilin family)